MTFCILSSSVNGSTVDKYLMYCVESSRNLLLFFDALNYS